MFLMTNLRNFPLNTIAVDVYLKIRYIQCEGHREMTCQVISFVK